MSDFEEEEHRPVVISRDQTIPGTEFYDMWNIGQAPNYKAQVPIFTVYNMHGLNSIIGYVMLINSNVGKVLYRGQTRLYCGENGAYNDLLPSFCPYIRRQLSFLQEHRYRLMSYRKEQSLS